MPRVPTYQPGQVAPVQATQTRFRAPDNPGALGILAEGLAGAAHMASAQDKINLENDQTQARQSSANARVQLASRLDQYKALRMGAARAGQADYDAGVDKIVSDTLASASNPRMRRMMELDLQPLQADYRRMGAGHSLEQSRDETDSSFKVEQQALIDTATGSDDPAFRDQQGLALRDSVRRQLAFAGFDEKTMPDAFSLAEKDALTRMHGGVLDRKFATADPDYNEIGHYLTAYRDEMSNDLYTKTLARMQGPLQERMDDARADLIHVAPLAGDEPKTAGPWQNVAVNVAKRFGLDPTDVAGAISYETGGTFSPTIMGGKGGQYMGLIQFGPAERKKYGITKSSTPEEWTNAIGDFLEDRGFKRGMGMLDLYSTINAGTPGRYNASDGNGTVTSHVAEILRVHKEKAKAWLGGAAGYSNSPRDWDKSAVYQQIADTADREGWSPEATKRVRAVWDKRMSADQGLLSEQRRSADEAATSVLASAGDNFRTSMIPRSTWSQLGPDQQIQFQDIEKRLTKAEAPTANGETVVALHRMMNGGRPDQMKFAQANLAKYRPYMTPGEFDELATAQTKLQQDLRNPKGMDVRDKIDSAITRGKRWSGIDADKDPTEGFRIRRYMEQRATDEAGTRTMGDADFDRLFRDATKQINVDNRWGFSAGQQRSSQLLSPNYRAVITRAFRSANGRDPTETEVQQAWEQMGAAGN